MFHFRLMKTEIIMKQALRIALTGLLLYGAISRSNAQTQVQLKQVWVKHLRGTGGDEYPNGMAVYPDGTVLVGGRFTGSSMDADYPASQLLSSISANDGFLVQYAANGNVQAKGSYNYNQNDAFNTVVFGPNKKRYALGASNSGIGNFSYANLLISSADSNSATLTHSMSDNGTLVNAFSGSAADAAGFIYGGGYFGGTVNTNFGRGTGVSVTSAAAQDAVLVKHFPDRSVRWALKFGGSGNDYIHNIAVAGDMVYAVGRFEGTVDFNPGAGTFNLSATTGISNGFVAKFDTAGNFMNAWVLNCTGASVMQDIKVDAAGNMFIAGYFAGTADANLNAGVFNTTSAGGNDAFIMKLSPAGDLAWIRKFGGTSDDATTRVAIDGFMNIYVSGYFNSASIDPGYPGTTPLTNAGPITSSDAFIVAYDSSGNSITVNRLGSSGTEVITHLAFDAANNLYATGYFNSSTLQTDLYPGYPAALTVGSSYDGFLVKYNTLCPYKLSDPFDRALCAGNGFNLPALFAGSNLSYQWKKDGVNLSDNAAHNGTSNDTLNITSLTLADTGKYVLQVTRPGCSSTASREVAVSVNPGNQPATPVNYFKFSGTLANQTGGAAAAFTGTATYAADRFGNASRAISAPGLSNSYLVPPAVSGVRVSLSMWINHSGTSYQQLFTDGSNDLLYLNNGKLFGSFGTPIDFGYTIPQNTWTHVAYVKDSTKVSAYVNGTKVYENDTLAYPVAMTVKWLFKSMSGQGDDVKIYDFALKPAEVASLYLLPEQNGNLTRTVTACQGTNLSLKARFFGNGLTYQWFNNGVALNNGTKYTGATTDSLVLLNTTSSDTGNYYVVAKSDCAGINSDTSNVFIGTAALNQGLLSVYPLNSNLLDTKGTNNGTGSVSFSLTNRFANSAQSCFFIGSAQTSVSITPVTSDTLSVSLWYYATQTPNSRTLLSASSGNARHLATNSSAVLGFITSTNIFIPSTVTLAANTWYHLAITKTGNNEKIYVNGQLVLNSNQSFLNSIVANSFTRFGGHTTNTETAGGYIDDLRIYSKELNVLEVTALGKLFEIRRQPSNARACNGSESLLFTAAFENNDSTQYTLQWKKDGIPLVNGLKYSGANNDTLWVTNATFADTGSYSVEITPVNPACVSWTTSAARMLIDLPSEMKDSLRWYLKLGNNTLDASGRNQVNTAFAITYQADRLGAANAAGSFGGTTSVVYGNGVPVTTSTVYSVALWFKSNQSFGGMLGASNVAPGTSPSLYHPLLYIGNDNKLRGKVSNGNGTVMASANDVNDNAWHHAALVVDGVNQYLYLDGQQVGTLPASNVTLPAYITAGTIWGGWTATTSNAWNYFQGNLDEIRFYNRALSANDVTRLAQSFGFAFSGLFDQSACSNTPVVMQSQSVGSGLSYTWKKNGVALSNTANVHGTDSIALVINQLGANDPGYYQCQVSKQCLSIVSDSIRLINIIPATVVNQPQHMASCAGGTASVSLNANGTSLTYQWKRANGTNMANGANTSGVNSATLTISNLSAADTGTFYCVISNTCRTDSTQPARISLNNGLQIIRQPSNTNACMSSNTFLSVATTDPGATYTWRKNGITISGSNNDTLFLNAVSVNDAAQYSVIINSICGTDTSMAAGLTVNTATAITTQPVNKGLCGTSGFSLQVMATGVNLTYQWKKNGANINGANATVYSIATSLPSDTGNYTVTVTGDCGTPVTSTVAQVRLSNPLTITLQPINQVTICPGNNYINLTVAGTGSITRYQWYRNGIAIQNQNFVTGATSNQLQFLNSTLGPGKYTCTLFGMCDTLVSDTTLFSYYPLPDITVQPVAKSVCTGGTVYFTVKAQHATAYRWYFNGTALSDFSGKISGANTDSITAQNVVPGDLGGSMFGNVYVDITGSCPAQVISSNSVPLTLNTSLNILEQSPSSLSVCEAGTAVLFVKPNIESSYQWRKDGNVINGETKDSLKLSALSAADAASYTCDLSSSCGNVSTTASVLTVNPAPAPTINVNGNVLSTQSFATYQWYKDNTPINGANQQQYTATSNGLYSVEVSTGNGCSALSAQHSFFLSGLAQVEKNAFGLMAYPNPVHEYLYLHFDAQLKAETIEVIDATGKTISLAAFEPGHPLDVSQLAAGIYMLQVKVTGTGTARIRFIKQ